MALIEKQVIDKIEVIENGTIQIRTATIIEKDGQEISKTFHRHVVHPIDDITKEDARVQAIANAVWTNEVVNQYKKFIEQKNTNN